MGTNKMTSAHDLHHVGLHRGPVPEGVRKGGREYREGEIQGRQIERETEKDIEREIKSERRERGEKEKMEKIERGDRENQRQRQRQSQVQKCTCR